MTPLVSIVIPVYNGERYLCEAIDSALAQTYENTEIIIVNDGSTDKTEELALSYGDKIRYFSKENGGVSTALNLAISQMRGEYFSWLSHDDIYRPDKLKLEIAALSNNPLQIVYSDYDVIDGKGRTILTVNIAKKYPNSDKTLGLFPLLTQTMNGCTLLIHKRHFQRVGLFDEKLRFTQDYDLWFKMFRDVTLIYINQSLVMMREHGQQVTHAYEQNRTESDALWLQMLKNITPEEAYKLGGSESHFWKSRVEFLCFTPYTKARKYSQDRLKAFGGETVSLELFIRRIIYQILSFMAKLIRIIGIQNSIRKSFLFRWAYKIWFGVRNK